MIIFALHDFRTRPGDRLCKGTLHGRFASGKGRNGFLLSAAGGQSKVATRGAAAPGKGRRVVLRAFAKKWENYDTL